MIPIGARGVRAQPVEEDVGAVRERAGKRRPAGGVCGLAWPHDEGGEADEGNGTDAVRGPAVRVEQQVDVRENAERAKEGGLPGPGGFRAERGRPLHHPARGKAGERMSDGRRHPVRRLPRRFEEIALRLRARALTFRRTCDARGESP